MRWLVCGGRAYNKRWQCFQALSQVAATRGKPTEVLTGAARGADSMAMDWCREEGIDFVGMPARWHADGKAAGPIRNARMLTERRPDLVIAFPGGTGTADMVKKAEKAGVEVLDLRE